MAKVRVSAKAIIISDGRLLALRNSGSQGDWFSLPGGGQAHGEPLHAALNRECLEEIGSEVVVGRLRYVRDYIAEHHEFASVSHAHQLELMFECELTSTPGPGTNPDSTQIGMEWLDLGTLRQSPLYPKVLRALLADPAGAEGAVYLGDVN